MNQRNRGLRNGQRQSQQPVFRKPDHRHGLGLRGCSGLDQRTAVGVSFGDDACEGRGDDRILKQRFETGLFRLRDANALLACGDVRLGGGYLRLSHQVAGVLHIHFLLRHQARLPLGDI